MRLQLLVEMLLDPIPTLAFFPLLPGRNMDSLQFEQSFKPIKRLNNQIINQAPLVLHI